jgi:hypothetical protein
MLHTRANMNARDAVRERRHVDSPCTRALTVPAARVLTPPSSLSAVDSLVDAAPIVVMAFPLYVPTDHPQADFTLGVDVDMCEEEWTYKRADTMYVECGGRAEEESTALACVNDVHSLIRQLSPTPLSLLVPSPTPPCLGRSSRAASMRCIEERSTRSTRSPPPG